MRKKLTVTVAEDVYEGLRNVIGARNISIFLAFLARPHVVSADMDAAYAALAADETRERQALEWVEGTMAEVAGDWEGRDEARRGSFRESNERSWHNWDFPPAVG